MCVNEPTHPLCNYPVACDLPGVESKQLDGPANLSIGEIIQEIGSGLAAQPEDEGVLVLEEILCDASSDSEPAYNVTHPKKPSRVALCSSCGGQTAAAGYFMCEHCPDMYQTGGQR